MQSAILADRVETVDVASYMGSEPELPGVPRWVSYIPSGIDSRMRFLCPVERVWDQIHTLMLNIDDSADLAPWWIVRQRVEELLVSFLIFASPCQRLTVSLAIGSMSKAGRPNVL